MPTPASISHLEGYAYQAFPNLALEVSNGEPSRLIATRESKHAAQVEQTAIQAATLLLTAAYIDTTDLLIEILTGDSQECRLVRIDTSTYPSRRDAVSSIARAIKEASPVSQEDYSQACETVGAPQGKSPAVLQLLTGDHDKGPDWFTPHGIALRSSSNGTLELIADQTITSEASANLFLAQLDHIAVLLLSDPDAPFDLLTLDLSAEANLLSSNSPPFEPSRAHCVTDWLSHNATHRPDAIAHELYASVDDEPQRITYAQLHSRSDRLARWLCTHHGVKEGDSIAICSSRTASFYTANAAIWKVGACYVPIDVDLPTQRKAFIAEDSSARLVLCETDQVELFEGDIAVDLAGEEVEGALREDGGLFESRAKLDSLAYLLYTSGTTGTPKGCLQMHRGLFWAIEAMVAMPKEVTNPDTDKRLAMAAVAFDVHISEIAQSWALGTRLVSVASRLELLSDLQENIIRFGISHVGMVPSMIEATLTKPVEELPIKYIVSGGEKATDAVIEKWATKSGVVFANFYGPTEATVGCTARRVKVGDRKDNIGQPFPACTAYVARMDDKGQAVVVPRGVPGELIVEGALVGRGYLGLEEATKKAFLEWPSKGCRAYRTGDLVRMSPDGSILIAGRIDSQIKLRGVRIESEGVSNVIRQSSPDVELDAISVVTSHPQVGGSELLVTFVAQTQRFSAVERREAPAVEALEVELSEKLRDGANAELASYMRPAHIVPVNFLPLSHNGKIDAKVLMALFRETKLDALLEAQHVSRSGGRGGSEAESREATESEAKIIEQISSIIDAPDASFRPNTRFAEAGLSSIELATLTRRLRKAFECRLAVADLLVSSDVQGCVKLIDARINGKEGSQGEDHETLDITTFDREHRAAAAQEFSPEDIESVLPPFPVQPGVLYQTSVSPEKYVQHFLYRCDGVESVKLEGAWRGMMERHEILRAVFVESGAQPLLVILKATATTLPLKHQKLADAEASSDASFVDTFNSSHASTVAQSINEDFTSPMWALTTFRAPSSSSLFVALSLNHAIYDAFAVRALMEDLDASVGGHALDTAPTPLGTILAELGAPDTSSHKDFWTKHLASRPEAPQRRSSSTEGRSKRLTHTFANSFADVRASCSSHGVSVQAFFNAVFALSARDLLSWKEAALFGGIRSGRNVAIDGVDKAVCPLVTLVPTLVPLHFGTGAEVLAKANDTLVQSLPHEHVPLGLIQRWIGTNDLIRALFSCRIEAGQRSYTKFQHIGGTPIPPEFPLAIEVLLDESADTIEARTVYIEEEFGGEEVRELLEHMDRVVDALLSGDDDFLQLDPSLSPRSSPSSKEQSRQGSIAVDPKVLAKVTQIISAFLEVEGKAISPSTSLVSLGLTSLRAIGLARRLKDDSLKVHPLDIIQGDSARSIAAKLSDGKDGTDASDEDARIKKLEEAASEELDRSNLKLTDTDDVELALCTPLQAGMLSQTISAPGSAYFHAFVLQLERDTSISKVQGAWKDAIAHFDILRTSFHFAAQMGRWIQAVHSAEAVDLQWESLTLSDATDPHKLSKQLLADHSIASEEELKYPPLYLRHIHTGSSEYLIVALHHALYDGVSLNNLLRHVTSLYRKEDLSPSVSFASIARQIVAREETATAYWVSRMDGANTFHVLPDVDTAPSKEAWRSSTTVALRDSADIARVTKRYKVNAQTIGQLALAKVLAVRSKSSDVTMCQVVSGRTLEDAGEVIGPVFNTIPCRVQLSTRSTGRDALRQLQLDNTESMTHQHASLRSIQQQLHCRLLGDVLFVFQPLIEADGKQDRIWTLQERPSEVHETQTHFALNVEFHEGASSLDVKASCAKNVMSLQVLDELLEDIREAVLDVLYNTTKPIFGSDVYFAERDVSTKARREIASNGTQNGTGVLVGRDEDLDDTQSKVQELLAQILGIEKAKLHIDARLVSLGLDSISAIQLASKARREGIKLVPNDVIKAATFGALMEKVKSNAKDATQVNGSKSKHRVTRSARLDGKLASRASSHLESALQKGIISLRAPPGVEYLFAGWQYAGGRAFHLVFCRSSLEKLDVERLKKAWNQLAQRHAILRATVAPTGDNAVRLALNVVDSSTFNAQFVVEELEEENEDAAVRARARQLLQDPTPISQPSPRMTVLQSKKRDYVLIDLMHIHYDAWSIKLLTSDLEALYLGREATAGSNLEDYASICSTPADTLQPYWESLFKNPPALLKTAQSAKQVLVVKHVELHNRSKTLPTLQALQSAARSLDVSSTALVIGAWAHVHALHSVKSAAPGLATFGLVVSGRSSAEMEAMERLALPCLNLIPMNIDDIDSSPSPDTGSLRATAKRVHEQQTERPDGAEQAHLTDIAASIGRSGKVLVNVSVNATFALAGQSYSTEDTNRNGTTQLWKPFQVPYMLEESEQPSSPLKETYGANNGLLIPEVQLDLRLVAAASESGRLVLTAHAGVDRIDAHDVEELLQQWGEFVVAMVGSS